MNPLAVLMCRTTALIGLLLSVVKSGGTASKDNYTPEGKSKDKDCLQGKQVGDKADGHDAEEVEDEREQDKIFHAHF